MFYQIQQKTKPVIIGNLYNYFNISLFINPSLPRTHAKIV
jgi:hypothetical protein